MFYRIPRIYFVLCAVVLLQNATSPVFSQTGAEALIRTGVDEARTVTLAGNTRPEATAANDAGEVADDLPLNHMMLQLKRSPQQEKAIGQLIEQLHDPKSPKFHQWLSAAEFGRQYSVAESDVKTVTNWLEGRGFTVNTIYPGGVAIDFSGDAGHVRQAFHTSIHNLNVDGVKHIANMSDPQIPEALAPAVAGVVSLHNFFPRRMSRAKSAKNRPGLPQFTGTSSGQTFQLVTPADFATIYDFNPLFAKGITGSGQTIVVVEDTNLYTPTRGTSDWAAFRSAFGLSQYTTGSLTTEHPAPPSGASNCASPGVNSDDVEAILDAEWASAAAPGAAIVVASCANTDFTSGLFTAVQNLVNASAPPPIVSISYGSCESENGPAQNAFISSLFQQAVTEGISVFVSAGDEGAASCDAGATTATHGLSVSGFASTAYNVAVGGTDFSDTYSGTAGNYWLTSNSATYGSAVSYIPEIPWDDSCANSLIAAFEGYPTTYGANGFCGSETARTEDFLEVVAGSGGPSNCAYGSATIPGVTSGTCAGYAKPSWQAGLAGIPNDGVRDIPDISLFASNGSWGHYSIICFTDPNNGGEPCTGSPANWAGVGGTSIASPEMAGLQALVNQNTGSKQGNPNYVYYNMAVTTPSAFHPVIQGNIDVNCEGPVNCFGFAGALDYGRDGRIFGTTWAGVLSVSSSAYVPAYAAGSAWNLANGIGSVDAYNLVMNWVAK